MGVSPGMGWWHGYGLLVTADLYLCLPPTARDVITTCRAAASAPRAS